MRLFIALLLASSAAYAAPFTLHCDYKGGNISPGHETFRIDVEAKTINDTPAEFGPNLVKFDYRGNRYELNRHLGTYEFYNIKTYIVDGFQRGKCFDLVFKPF